MVTFVPPIIVRLGNILLLARLESACIGKLPMSYATVSPARRLPGFRMAVIPSASTETGLRLHSLSSLRVLGAVIQGV